MTRSSEPGKRRVKPQIKSASELKLASARSGFQCTSLLGQLTGHPAAFAVVLVYAGLWVAFDRQHFDFNAVATLAVWIMTLLIQRANRRDTLALHAKLDELLRVDSDARSELTRLEEKEPEEIEIHRDAEVRKAGPKAPLSPE
jgi:low affinity Fe/Cu permease